MASIDIESVYNEMMAYYVERMPYYDECLPTSWITDDLLNDVRAALARRDVLEIACGTGFWSGLLADTASSVHGIDAHPSVLCLAKAKRYPENVRFSVADAYELAGISRGYSAAFAADWWSHVPHSMQPRFLRRLHSKLSPGATVVFVDHLRWPSKSASHVDRDGNLIQTRTLRDGSERLVLKNFPTRDEIRRSLADWGDHLEYEEYPDCGVKRSGRWRVSYIAK